MAKTISFKIRLEGSKEVLSEIDKISKALSSKLKASKLTIDEKGLKEATKATEQLKKNVTDTGRSVSQVTKEMAALESQGKQNTDQYKKLADEAGKLKVAQQQARDAAKRSEADLRNQVNLQKLLNGEIKATDLSQKQFFQALNSGIDQADPKYQELVQDFVRLKQEQKEFNDNLRIQQRLLESGSDVSGRFRKLNAELVNARSAYRDLTDEEIRSGKISDQLVKKYGLQSNSVKELENRVSQLDKELKETDARLGNFQRNVGNYTSAFRGAASALGQIGIGLGVSELASATRQLISESTELFDIQERADAQLRTVLASTEGVAGRTLEQLKQFAQERQKLTLFGDEETQQIQALLLTFTNIQDDTFDRATVAVQDYATALANASGGSIDARSASIQLGKALNDPIKGLTALGRSGVQFNDEQKELIAGFVESGELAKAQGIILEELERQFAGSAEAAAQAGTGATKQLQNQISDLKEEIGEEFAPVLENATRLQLAFFQRLSTVIPKAIKAIGDFIAVLLSIPSIIKENRVEIAALTTALVALNFQAIAAAANTLRQIAASKAAVIATRAQAVAQRLLNTVMKANPIGLAIAAVAGLVAIFARLYKSSQTLRSGIAGTFGALKKIVGNVVGGIVKQLTGFGQLLKGVFTLNLDDIKAGAKRYAEGVGDIFLRAGKGAGDAFNEGFDAKTALDLNNAIEDAIAQGDSQIGDKVNDQIVTALEKGQITNAQADEFQAKLQEGIDKATKVEETSIKETGFNLGKDFGSGVALGLSDSEKQIVEARKKALENINKLEAGLITNEFDAQVVQAETSAASDISGLVGDPEQIRRQETLIKAQLGISLGEIEQARINSFAQTIERAQQAAANEIALLTGSPNEIEQQSFIIRQSLVAQIEGISSDRDAAINQAIADAQARRDAEIAALTGSPEEIEANAATIRQTYSKVITDLGNTRKQLTQAQEIELTNLRKQISQELGGELNADLKAAGAEELRILQENVNKRLDVINKETERRKEALKDAAELQRQRIQLELASETNPRRKEQLNKQLTDLEKQLQSDLLQVDKDGADKRLRVAKTLVSDSTKLAQGLADVEKRIDKQKNDELIRNARQRAAEIEEIEKAAKDALKQGAFDFAGAIGQDIIEGERARVDAQIDLERSRADASAEQQEKSTRESYEKQIAAAEGNAEKQEQLRQELSDKLTSIDRNRAAKERSIQRREAIERKKIARKEAIIQGALAVVRALALSASPAAAVAAGIAAAVQLAIIEAQRFEEGGALSGAVGNFIATGADAITAQSLPEIQRSSPGIPTEGLIQGPRHTAGGVKASFNGTAVEAEGGEYKLKNGGETYIINRKSTKLFRPQLDSLRGNVHKFDPVKRVIASNINSFGGNGVKFAEGGALGVDVNKPLQVPQALQSLSGGITREELNTSISRIYEGLGAISKSLDSKTDSIATNLQQEIAAINSRIDRIRVYNDPVEVVNAGNERIKAQASAEL